MKCAFQHLVDANAVISEGREKFSGHPFILPSFFGSQVVVGPENVDFLRTSSDSIFSQPLAINESLMLDYTLNDQQIINPYQVTVVRTDFTRAIAAMIPEVLQETKSTIKDTFFDAKSITIPVFNTMTGMVARISNRAILGTDLCRNKEYIHSIVHFAETLILYGSVLKLCFPVIRPVVYFVLVSVFGGKKQPLKFLVPYLRERFQERQKADEKPITLVEFLIRAAPANEIADPALLALRIMNMNFGAIHTSSIFITQALFEIAAMPQDQVDGIRTEVLEAVESADGWNKTSLAKFRKLDSLLKEVGRVYGLSMLGLNRIAMRDVHLPDGTLIPAGYQVSVDLRTVHFNPDVYPNPNQFDAFRFSKLRESEDSDIKHSFTTVGNDFLPFGVGRHACPGRFFASMEIKIMLALILVNYDVSFIPGTTERPKNVFFTGGIVPDPKAQLVFKRRQL
jgi:cytochrome P450